MKILFFGRLRDSVGASALSVALPETVRDTEDLRAWLACDHPALAEESVKIAVNAQLHPGNVAVSEADEIAFLPPMSGG